MTRLRKMMLEELERRNYSARTARFHIREYQAHLFSKRKLSPGSVTQHLAAIERCRTATLGGHLDECSRCGHRTISYNSCRNRHCPQCQAAEFRLTNRNLCGIWVVETPEAD